MAKRGKVVWTHFPKDRAPDSTVVQIVESFKDKISTIDSEKFGKSGNNKEKTKLTSDFVLSEISSALKKIPGMRVEEIVNGKKTPVRIPVLYGDNGKIKKAYNPDGWHEEQGILLEVEAGMMIVSNKTHLEDLIKAIQIPNIKHFVVAGARVWDYKGQKKQPYDKMVTDFTSFYESTRVILPFETLTVIGF